MFIRIKFCLYQGYALLGDFKIYLCIVSIQLELLIEEKVIISEVFDINSDITTTFK